MDSHGEMGMLGENFDLGMIGRIRDDGYESRSGSDNLEGASGDDQDAGDDQPPRKKKYHRHTPNQIQELEGYDFLIFCFCFFALCYWELENLYRNTYIFFFGVFVIFGFGVVSLRSVHILMKNKD